MRNTLNTDRRTVLKLFGGGAGALAVPYLIRPKPAWAQAGVVNVSTYDKFLPKDFVEKFQQETGIEVRIRLTDDQGKQYSAIVAEGANPTSDIVTVSGHRVPQWVDSNLLTELDMAKLPNWNKLSPIYVDAPWITYKDKKWALPLLAGYQGMAINTNRVTDADSWAAMFDDKYKGYTSYIITDFLSVTMKYLGFDGEFVSYVGKDEESKKAIDAARDLLISKKANVRKYYNAPSDIQQMFVNEDVYLAHAWSGPMSKLIMDGQPIRTFVPKEGTYGFCYNLNIVNNAPNADNAHKLLNAILASPEVGAAMTRQSGFISTISGVEGLLNDREKVALSLPQDQAERVTYSSSANRALLNTMLDRAKSEIMAA